jgi:tripartite-type tricarboxylate transporter receptor subunit TctC
VKVTRRTLLGTIAAGFAAGSAFKASAEGDWPSRIVRLVSPYGAGGASDISLRILAEQFGRSLKVHRREQGGRGHPRRQ